MDWKEFFWPTLKKFLIYAFVYFMFTPLLLCIVTQILGCVLDSSTSRTCECTLFGGRLSFSSFMFFFLGPLVMIANENFGAIWVFLFGIISSYIIACTIIFSFDIYMAKQKGRKKR